MVADKWRLKFLQAFQYIARWPGTGHPYFAMEDLPVRVWNVGPYFVFFRPETDPVEIVAIEHGAQKLPRIL